MDVRERRLARLQQLLDEHDGNKASLARMLKKQPAQVSQWFTGIRTITEDSAREIEINANRPEGWLDTMIAGNREPTIDQIVRGLPSEERHDTLEHLRFKIMKAAPLLAAEDVATYLSTIDKLDNEENPRKP